MKNSHLLLILLTLCFSSCRTVLFYSNDPVVNPQVDEQGDFNCAGGINLSQYNKSLHLNVNVAVTDKIYLSSSFTQFNNSNNNSNVNSVSNSINKFSGYNFNFATGLYKKIKNNRVLEIGVGIQNGYNENTTNSLFTNIYRNKFYIQPGISKINENFHFGVGIRIGMLDITKINSNDPDFTTNNTRFKGAILAEPGLNISFGRIVKFGAQISYCIHEFSTLNAWSYLFGGFATDDFSLSFFLKLDINRSNNLPQLK